MYRRTSNLFVRISVYNKLTHKIQSFHEGKNLNTTWMELDNDFIVPLALVFFTSQHTTTKRPKCIHRVAIPIIITISNNQPNSVSQQWAIHKKLKHYEASIEIQSWFFSMIISTYFYASRWNSSQSVRTLCSPYSHSLHRL